MILWLIRKLRLTPYYLVFTWFWLSILLGVQDAYPAFDRWFVFVPCCAAVGVTAERGVEQDINRIVLANGLKISHHGEGAISAVSALRKVYAHGPNVLTRTLRIAKNAYGDEGLHGHVLEGIGLVCARYNGELKDDEATAKLATARGGIGALNTRAYITKKQLGKPMPQCVASAAVEIINAGRGGKKLPGWWA